MANTQTQCAERNCWARRAAGSTQCSWHAEIYGDERPRFTADTIVPTESAADYAERMATTCWRSDGSTLAADEAPSRWRLTHTGRRALSGRGGR